MPSSPSPLAAQEYDRDGIHVASLWQSHPSAAQQILRPITPPAASALPTAAARLAALFLPDGFPASVTPDYLPYQAWDTVQALATYVRGVGAGQDVDAAVHA
jgi:hypothetical protein